MAEEARQKAGEIVEGDDSRSWELRRGVWAQTATTVALVTTASDGEVDVMACEWAMMVSGSPLRFAIAVAPSRVTYRLIERSGEFGLNFCSDQQGASPTFPARIR